MKTETPPTVRLADYQPPAFLIDHVDLTVRLDGENTAVTGRYSLRANPAADEPTTDLVLHADRLPPVDMAVNGVPADLVQDEQSVRLAVPHTEPFELTVTTVLNPAANKALSGLYLTQNVYCTQCEAEGFRRILPFLDRPDVLATYRVTLEARQAECPVLLSNGNLESQEDLGDGWHRAVWHDPHPKPSYLFALVGGRLDHIHDQFVTADGRTVHLAIYVEPGKTGQAGFAMDALKRSMRWDEERFGRIYDLDVFNIVAVSDFNLGAMENKGLNIFNDKYILASPEIATDEDYERIEAIIAHEYFHNWSGNRVTCRDWFQLCLKEGLTVYRDQEYTADLTDRTIKRIQDVRDLWAHQFPEDAGPLAHPVRPDSYREINNFYTATVYEKGAEIVRMVATWMGRDRFRAGMDRYFASHDGEAVRMEEFLAAMKAEADDLGPWPDFLSWYTQAGTPHVSVDVARGAGDGALTLRFAQITQPTPGQPDKIALPIPCALGLVSGDGQEVDLSDVSIDASGGRWAEDRFLLEEPHGTLTVSGLPAGTVRPSLFRDFSAPVTIESPGIDTDDRLALAASDPNGFNSWAHFQALFTDALQRRYHRLGLGEPLGRDEALFDAMMARALAEPAGDENAAARAAAITLPSAHDLARTLTKDVDPDRVVAARTGFSRDLCSRHGEAMLSALADLDLQDGVIGPVPAARRALAAALLQHLARWDDPRAEDALINAHEASIGMTMRIKTLALLLQRQSPAADPALKGFTTRFGHEPLAMDKWLVVQASTSPASHIEALEENAAYDATNPNRVRSLLGAFSTLNLAGFHAGDGSGYRLLSDRIATLDAANPQLAASLAVAFRSWRTMDEGRRCHAKAALDALQGRANLSTDLADIVARTLAG